MKDKLLKLIVGKNLPHLARVAITALGAWLLTGALFSPDTTALDPAIGDAIAEVHAPSAEQVRDGLDIGEIFGVVGGTFLIWLSGFLSYLRGRNYDWLANWLGPIIGRSLPSLLRAGMTVLAAAFARFTAQPELAPEAFAQMPAATAIGAVLLVIANNVFSASEDAKRNPVLATPTYPIDER